MGFLSAIAIIIAVIFIIMVCCGCAKGNDNGGFTQSTDNIRTIDTKFREKGEICPRCGSNVPTSSKFCNNCGYNLNKIITCPYCGSKLSASSQFCSNCGNHL